MLYSLKSKVIIHIHISLAENHKGTNADQRCSVANQKGAFAMDFAQR